MNPLEILAPDGLPEITPASDLPALVVASLAENGVRLVDGDIVVVTSKAISKAEGRVRTGGRDEAIAEETVRVVARRGRTLIVRNRLGLTMAAAGIDASNVAAGSIVLLPLDPDASARSLRSHLRSLTGACVGVVITDTAGRAWREGQTDMAIGAAGLRVAEDYAGLVDAYGNDLQVTLPAVADEIAGAAELALGKLSGRPVAVLRGRGDLVLPDGESGPGARSLIRAEGGDLFGYGAREAVIRALAGHDEERTPFGATSTPEELTGALDRVGAGAAYSTIPAMTADTAPASTLTLAAGCDERAVSAICFAHGWRLEHWHTQDSTVIAHISPVTP